MEDKQLKIHVTNLKKNFGKLEVLKDISVDVQEGEVVVLLGPSGSGKSTLLRCLNQLETATSGKIIIDGHDVTDKHTDINKVRENIGMVFQHFNLFNHLTVLDNIILPACQSKKNTETRKETVQHGQDLMRKLGIIDIADNDINEVSGGQLQRACICRSMINRPKMIFADEPTGALNRTSSDEVMEELLKLNDEGTTIMLVTHDVKVAAKCTRALYIVDGNIKASLIWTDTKTFLR